MQMSKSFGAFTAETGAGAAGPGRRELLTTLLAVALADTIFWPLGAADAQSLPLAHERFLELSSKLCAMQIKDEVVADLIQKALASRFPPNELKRIADILASAAPQDVDRLIAHAGFHELAQSIVAVWYSGQVRAGEAARVIAYEEALAWPATGYAKAPGTCGVFGEWTAKPPNASEPGHRP
jgi:hypothetical protein